MASSAVSSAAHQISKLLVDEAKYLYDVKHKIEALYDELTWMRSFLQDADAREQNEEIIRLWVSQIRDFAYEAEDIIEKYLHRVSNHRQEGYWNTIKWFSCVCYNCFDCMAIHAVGNDIDRLKQRISNLCSRMQIYGVKTKSKGKFPHRRRVMELRRTHSEIQREEIVGLRDDIDKLVQILKSSDHKVICISGMGGLGKTTLVQMVYGDVKEYQNQAWVYVSQQFQTRNILEAILLKLAYIDTRDNRNIKYLRDEELPPKVRQVLLEKKCLVVLDDVWTKEDWKKLAPSFATLRHSQSKLLLTTRKETLLSHVDGQGHHHKARKLTKEESWQLLQKIALSGVTSADVDMKKVGEKMSKYCDGLPLALVVLGGILATKSSLSEWENVQANVDSLLKNSTSMQDSLSILEVLELSYFDLPYYLKPCFLYMGNFPEDYEIPTKRLYQMWAIEGIVAQPTYTTAEQVSVEAIAEDYLKELVDRCLVQLGRTDKTGKIKSCRLHDLIRDMCLKKSKEENFLNVIENGDFKKQSSSLSSSHINPRLRRLTIYTNECSSNLQHLISDKDIGHVRSLLFFPVGVIQRKLEWSQGTVSEALKLVRVLAFEDFCIRSLPKEI